MSGLTEYAIRYWRPKEWERRFETAGMHRPEGWVISNYRYQTREEALKDIAHINRQGPRYLCELVVFWNGVERQ